VGSNACAGSYRNYLSRNMVRFHAPTRLARLPYFLAVSCLCPQLQSILSLFIHREPGVPSNLPLELTLYQQYARLPQQPQTDKMIYYGVNWRSCARNLAVRKKNKTGTKRVDNNKPTRSKLPHNSMPWKKRAHMIQPPNSQKIDP